MTAVSTLTTLDFLYLALSVAVIVLVIVICIALINLTFVLRDVRKISKTAGDVTEKFHSMILTPVNFVSQMSEALLPQLEELIKSQLSKKNKKAKK